MRISVKLGDCIQCGDITNVQLDTDTQVNGGWI